MPDPLFCKEVVLLLFAEEADLNAGRFAIHRAIKEEGLVA